MDRKKREQEIFIGTLGQRGMVAVKSFGIGIGLAQGQPENEAVNTMILVLQAEGDKGQFVELAMPITVATAMAMALANHVDVIQEKFPHMKALVAEGGSKVDTTLDKKKISETLDKVIGKAKETYFDFTAEDED